MNAPLISPYTSSHFFHFVGGPSPSEHEKNFNTLLAILRSKTIRGSAGGDGWGPIQYMFDPEGKLIDETLVNPGIVCFCDIPEDSLQIHRSKYGEFGIALKRDYLINRGLRPVMYFPTRPDDATSVQGSEALRDIEVFFRSLRKYADDHEFASSSRTMAQPAESSEELLKGALSIIAMQFIAFLKPFSSVLEDQDPDNYYLEREWRRLGNMKFDFDNVERVVVAEGFVEPLLEEFPQLEGKVRITGEVHAGA